MFHDCLGTWRKRNLDICLASYVKTNPCWTCSFHTTGQETDRGGFWCLQRIIHTSVRLLPEVKTRSPDNKPAQPVGRVCLWAVSQEVGGLAMGGWGAVLVDEDGEDKSLAWGGASWACCDLRVPRLLLQRLRLPGLDTHPSLLHSSGLLAVLPELFFNGSNLMHLKSSSSTGGLQAPRGRPPHACLGPRRRSSWSDQSGLPGSSEDHSLLGPRPERASTSVGLWLEELAFLRGLEMLKLLPWGYMEGFIIRNACLVLVQAWAQSTPKPWNFLSNRSVGASLVTVFGLLSSVPGDAPQPRMESMSPCSQGASFHPPLSGC